MSDENTRRDIAAALDTEDPEKVLGAVQRADPFAESDFASVCYGYVIVAEWMRADGGRYLSVTSSDAAGRQLPIWTQNGMLNEALNGDWPEPEADDDE